MCISANVYEQETYTSHKYQFRNILSVTISKVNSSTLVGHVDEITEFAMN